MKSHKWIRAEAPALAAERAARPRTASGAPGVTVGVEEEFLLVDPVSRELSTRADEVVAASAAQLGDRVTTELTRYQVEVRTDPHAHLTDLADQLHATRDAVARAAAGFGLRIVSSGTPILGQEHPPPFSRGARYARSAAAFRALDDEQTVCACHVHVAVPDLATALQLSNHLRPWLPALIALSANSPFWAAQDTGYASWRTMTWGRWPVAGPPPYFESRCHFEDLVERLLSSETLMDRGGLYWDIRPSHHLPTLEIRIADAALTVADTVLLVAAVKGLAATALTDVRDARPAPRPQRELLRAAYWRAARDGLTGQTLNLHTARLEPAAAHLDRLWNLALPPLETPRDAPLLRSALRHLHADGTGADRQRGAHHRRHRITDVVDYLIQHTSVVGAAAGTSAAPPGEADA